MFLMYVDESGDVGLAKSPTDFFILSGVIIHELRWQTYLDQLIAFRQRMKQAFGIHLREELHAASMINNPGNLIRIKRNDRLSIIRFFAEEIAQMSDLSIINVVVDKRSKRSDFNVFEVAWKALIQRFENTISWRNFPGPANADDRGIIFPDHTDDKKLRQLVRQMRRYNPVPNQQKYGVGYRNISLTTVIEDPNFRDSVDSYFVQIADLAAYLLYQKFSPNNYIRRKSAQNYFDRLEPVLCKVASSTDPLGIVRI